jgi:hypothetical protein
LEFRKDWFPPNDEPLTPFSATDLARHILRLKTKRGRLAALLVLLALLSTVAFSSSSARSSLGRFLFGASSGSNAASVKQTSSAFANENASLIELALDSSVSLTTSRKGHSSTLPADGNVLIVGGENADGFVTQAEIFDPASAVFTSGLAMGVARAGHSATLFADGRVFIAGGDANGSAEIFDPSSSRFSAVTANMTVARSMHSAALLREPARTTLRFVSSAPPPFHPCGCAFVMGRGRKCGEQRKHADVVQTPRYFANVNGMIRVSLLEVNNVPISFVL